VVFCPFLRVLEWVWMVSGIDEQGKDRVENEVGDIYFQFDIIHTSFLHSFTDGLLIFLKHSVVSQHNKMIHQSFICGVEFKWFIGAE